MVGFIRERGRISEGNYQREWLIREWWGLLERVGYYRGSVLESGFLVIRESDLRERFAVY